MFLLVLYLTILVLQIILLVHSIKEKTLWISLFLLEIFSIVISSILFIYYVNLPGVGFMPGLTYFVEILLSLGVSILYYIMLFITICAKIIIYEKNQKQQGKKYVNPFISIMALIFVIIGILFLLKEIIDNYGTKETIGTVVDFKEIRTGGKIEYWPIISFYVDGKEYKDDYPISDIKIGNNVQIYYYPVPGGYNITRYITDYKIIYIPAFIIGTLIIIFRFKDKIILKSYPNK